MKNKFYEIECGLLPLRNRFIRIMLGETVWIIPARAVLNLACAYYEEEGWYEECELEEDKSLKQLHGRELRGCVEVNTELNYHAKQYFWSELARDARRIAGPKVIPPGNDKIWWFEEEGGAVEEVTDLPLARQNPRRLLWFSTDFAKVHGIEVPA